MAAHQTYLPAPWQEKSERLQDRSHPPQQPLAVQWPHCVCPTAPAAAAQLARQPARLDMLQAVRQPTWQCTALVAQLECEIILQNQTCALIGNAPHDCLDKRNIQHLMIAQGSHKSQT